MRRKTYIRRSRLAPLAFITTAAVALGIVGLTAAPASALPTDVAEAEGQLLTGGGAIDTDAVAALAPAYSATPSGTSPVNKPLDLTALGAVNLDLGSGIQLLSGANPVLQLGVDGQYARTNADGSAFAAAGAINNDGSINAGAGDDPTQDTVLSLTPLLQQAGVSDSLISALEVRLGAISATASGSGGAPTGDYRIAGGQLVLTSPAVQTFTNTLTTTLNGVTSDLNAVLASGGVINDLTSAIGPIGSAIDALPLVSVSNLGATATLSTANLGDAVKTVTTVTSDDGVLTLNLSTGTVEVDLAKLLGSTDGTLNGLPANTHLLTSDLITNVLDSDLTDVVNSALGQITSAANTALNNTQLTIAVTGNVSLLGVGLAQTNLTIAGPLGGFLGVAGAAAPTVDTTGVNVLGLNIGAAIQPVLGGVVTALEGVVGGALEPVIQSQVTNNTVLNTAATTLAGALGGAFDLVGTVADVVVNVQETPGAFTTDGAGQADFTERAVQVNLLPGSTSLATVNLASASIRATTQLTLTPNAGPTDGGQTVTISGSSATDNATTVQFGDVTYYLAGSQGATDNPGAPTFTQDSTSGDIHLTTQPHAAGAVDVTVTSPTGTSNPATYTYYDAPTNLSLDPTQGPAAGGQTVTISGDDLAGATSVDFGGTTFYKAGSADASAHPGAPTFTQASDGTITLTTPAHAAGAVDVTVTNPGGTSDPLTYTYYDVPSNLVLTPDQGPVAGGQTVTITGDGLDGATGVTFAGVAYTPGTTATGTDFTQAADGTITLTTPAHVVGPFDVTVTNPAGTSDPATYTFVAAPGNLSLSPAVGPVAGGQTVVLSGDNLGTASAVDFGGTTFYRAGSAEATAHPDAPTFTQNGGSGDITLVTPAAPGGNAGPVDVTVTTAGGTTDPAQYQYISGPAITNISPDAGPVAGGQPVTIAGDGLDGATVVDFGGTPVYLAGSDDANTHPDSPTFTQDAATGSISFETPAGTAPGTVDVTVTGALGETAAFPYTYVAAPVAGAIDPASGPTAGGQNVQITGTNLDGATAVTFGPTTFYLEGSPDAAANPDAPTFSQLSDGTIMLSTPAHAAGAVAVTVTTPGGTTAPLTYAYFAAPAVTGVSPDEGPIEGDQPVTITGNNLCGATSVQFGDTTYYLEGSDAAAAHSGAPTFTQDATTCEISLTTPAGSGPGAVDVTVTTPGGESPAASYTYVAAPANLELNPIEGPTVGGQSVTITGDNLLGATVVEFAGTAFYRDGSPEADAHAGAPVFAQDATTGTITLSTPPHAAGDTQVTVTNAGGTSPVLIYTYVPAPANVSLSPNHGPQNGGTEVTLSGDDLDNATSVAVGDVTYYPQGSDAAAAHPDSPTFTQDPVTGAITLTTEPTTTAGPADVVVTTAGGSSPAVPFTFDPAPVIAAISPINGPTDGGQSVTITGSNLGGATSVSFAGTTFYAEGSAEAAANPDAPTFTQNPTTGAITLLTPPHAAGTVDVVVTTPLGVSNTGTYRYGVITPGTPTISGTASVGKTLTANPGTWGPSGVTPTYKWTLPDGTVIGTGKTLVVPASAAGKKITLTVTGTKAGYTPVTAGPVSVTVNAPTPAPTVVKRLQGSQRWQTALAISKDSFPAAGSADVVFIARTENFPDALSAGPAAAKLNGPLLLTPHNQLLPAVASEIKRLKPAKIIVVGGPVAINPNVFTALSKLAPTVREGGADRYETSVKIAKYAFGSKISGAFVATGVNFPDALSASAYSGAQRQPVLLVNGKASSPNSSLTSYLASSNPSRLSIAGGTAAVSTGIENRLEKATGLTAKRFAGSDRWTTSQAINAQFTSASVVYLATGMNFPDALSGSAAAGKAKAPLFVIPKGCLPGAVSNAIKKWHPATVKILGGPVALSQPAVDKLTVCK